MKIRTCLLILFSAIIASCQVPPDPILPPTATFVPGESLGEETSPVLPLEGEPTQAGQPIVTVTPSPSDIFIPFVKRDITPTSSPTPELPTGANILIIMSDDQRFDTMEYMPRTQALIFEQGAVFQRAYITTPSCCPSRASLLTGMYAHHHGVLVNQDELTKPTFVEDLHNAGYFTGLVGKYLNSWDGSMRPEFDYWVSFDGGSGPYFDPELNVQNEWRDHNGYLTHILRNYALQFLDQAFDQPAPFMLLFTPNAPHEPAEPAPRDRDLYPDLPLHRPPSFNEEDISDKPLWLHEYEPLTEERILAIDDLRRKQILTLNALDQAVESILLKLEEAGELDNTFILYYSDNGYFWGEHRWRRGKGYAWEESIHVPYAIRYPPLIPEPLSDSHLVSNIDIAPTIYQLAGLPAPGDMDGFSLIPLLQGHTGWRDRIVIENWVRFGPYIAVRTDRYLYVEWENGFAELYDTEIDPYQLENQAENSDYAAIVQELRDYLNKVRVGED